MSPPLMLSRRQLGALAAGSLLAGTAHEAQAADPDTFVTGFGLPMNLDPHQVFDVPMQALMLNAYDSLYRYEGDPPKIVPWLAQSYTGLARWPDLGFQAASGHQIPRRQRDDGRRRGLQLPAHAGAGHGACRRLPADPEARQGHRARQADGALRAQAVPTRRSSRRSPASASSTRAKSAPTRRTATGAAPGSPPTPRGSGAYRIIPASYRPLEQLDLDIFDGHFMGWEDNPKAVRKIANRPTQETSTRILALLNGSIDCTDTNLPADQVEQIDASKIAYVQKDVVMRIFLFRMNNTKPPFDNLNARRCFAHAFDYMGFIKDILSGYATRDPYPMPNTLWGCPADAKGYDFDMAKAKDYMAKAMAEGAPMKRPIEFHVQSENEQSVQAAQLFQSNLAELGINLKIVGDIWSNLTADRAQAGDHARHVGALDQHLLRRSRELGRTDVRQPVPRHLEGLLLVHQRQGGRAAAPGAQHARPG